MKTPIKYLLTIDGCMYCQTAGVTVDVTVAEYEANKRWYDAACHECTSEYGGYQSKTIFGGGPCCDPLGHKITPVYQD